MKTIRVRCNRPGCKNRFTKARSSNRKRCDECASKSKPVPNPTPEQIRKRSAAVRREWSEEDHRKRLGMKIADLEIEVLDLGVSRKQSTVGGRE